MCVCVCVCVPPGRLVGGDTNAHARGCQAMQEAFLSVSPLHLYVFCPSVRRTSQAEKGETDDDVGVEGQDDAHAHGG